MIVKVISKSTENKLITIIIYTRGMWIYIYIYTHTHTHTQINVTYVQTYVELNKHACRKLKKIKKCLATHLDKVKITLN